VGRIAAIVNHSHNSYYKDKTGFFGFFDCIDDPEVAVALFSAASARLREKGFAILRGPYNPTVNDEVGLMVEGFNSAPFVMMPYNPAYYLGLYEKLGLVPTRDLVAFYMPAEKEAPQRITRVVERIRKSSGITLRNINMARLNDELKVIHMLYNLTLTKNWGFVPITYEDLQSVAGELKAFVDPTMVMIAEKNGEPIGFSLMFPNINEIMWKVKKSPRWLRVIKFIWYLKTSHPREARLAVLGVHPEYRNAGLGALFYYETLIRGQKKYIGGELSWVDSENVDIIKGITLMGAKPYKRYRLFEKQLSA